MRYRQATTRGMFVLGIVGLIVGFVVIRRLLSAKLRVEDMDEKGKSAHWNGQRRDKDTAKHGYHGPPIAAPIIPIEPNTAPGPHSQQQQRQHHSETPPQKFAQCMQKLMPPPDIAMAKSLMFGPISRVSYSHSGRLIVVIDDTWEAYFHPVGSGFANSDIASSPEWNAVLAFAADRVQSVGLASVAVPRLIPLDRLITVARDTVVDAELSHSLVVQLMAAAMEIGDGTKSVQGVLEHIPPHAEDISRRRRAVDRQFYVGADLAENFRSFLTVGSTRAATQVSRLLILDTLLWNTARAHHFMWQVPMDALADTQQADEDTSSPETSFLNALDATHRLVANAWQRSLVFLSSSPGASFVPCDERSTFAQLASGDAKRFDWEEGEAASQFYYHPAIRQRLLLRGDCTVFSTARDELDGEAGPTFQLEPDAFVEAVGNVLQCFPSYNQAVSTWASQQGGSLNTKCDGKLLFLQASYSSLKRRAEACWQELQRNPPRQHAERGL